MKLFWKLCSLHPCQILKHGEHPSHKFRAFEFACYGWPFITWTRSWPFWPAEMCTFFFFFFSPPTIWGGGGLSTSDRSMAKLPPWHVRGYQSRRSFPWIFVHRPGLSHIKPKSDLGRAAVVWRVFDTLGMWTALSKILMSVASLPSGNSIVILFSPWLFTWCRCGVRSKGRNVL